MLQDIKNTVQTGKILAQKLGSYQIRAETKSAIVVMNGLQDVVSVYRNNIDIENSKELLQNIVDAANAVYRASQGAMIKSMKNTDFQNEEAVNKLRTKAKETEFGSTKGGVTITMNAATQEFTGVHIVDSPELTEFAEDLVNALNGALVKARIEMGKIIEVMA